MMLRRFNRVGPWLLVAAVGWYLAGCFLADHLSSESMGSANKVPDMDNSTASSVKIEVIGSGDNSYYYPSITLTLNPGISRTTIKNDDAGAVVNTTLLNGELDISVQKHASRHGKSSETLSIEIPRNVGTVSFSGNMRVHISGNAPELTLVARDQKPMVAIDALSANKLRYVANFNTAQDHEGRESSFNLDKDAAIRELEISMSHGTLDFSARALPAKTMLDLGNDVKVRADAPFLQSAKFGKLTQ